MSSKKPYSTLKKLMILLFMLIIVFVGYVEIVNLNSKNMSYRQKVLKAVYPALMWWKNITGNKTAQVSNARSKPPVSFFSLKAERNNGGLLDFASLRGKKVLIVNTASDCGYTDQYEDLQKLYEQHTGELVVLGFPANDFKEQEKGTDEEIAAFCKLNYGVSFPLMKKSVVKKIPGQNEVFKWLTDPGRNGWNDKPPTWNFTKFLINEEGVLTDYFEAGVSPSGKQIQEAIEKKL